MARLRKATRRQMNYLRYLERACDTKPHLRLSIHTTSSRITHLEALYKIIYNQQPMMRGS